jgi:hypothetical protein
MAVDWKKAQKKSVRTTRSMLHSKLVILVSAVKGQK